MPLEFSNPGVKAKFDLNPAIDKDFQIRVPKLRWYGKITDITEEVATQLVKEGYNHVTVKKPKS